MATITARARYSCAPTLTLNGCSLKSTEVTSSVMNSVPKRSACSRKRTIRSGPRTPSGNPGKFSTSDVIINWPPASKPSMQSGRRFAREA